MPWALEQQEKALVEGNLVRCKCGGKFCFDAPPRCPACKSSIAALLPDRMHYYILPDSLDGTKGDSIWIPRERTS